MGKITIKHYLNTNLKPSYSNGVLEYPVYFRVSHNRKNERIKSDWIVHSCSESDFANDIHIAQLIEYETDIISDIIEKAGDKDFNLRARLINSKAEIVSIFLGYMFDKHEIKNQIIDFVSKKADISKSILSPYFNDEYTSEEWQELYTKGVFNEVTRDKIIYLSMLIDFEQKEYPPQSDEIFGYRAGCLFIPYEWRNKNKEQKFMEFAEKADILPKNKLLEITEKFNIMLLKYSTLDVAFER